MGHDDLHELEEVRPPLIKLDSSHLLSMYIGRSHVASLFVHNFP